MADFDQSALIFICFACYPSGFARRYVVIPRLSSTWIRLSPARACHDLLTLKERALNNKVSREEQAFNHYLARERAFKGKPADKT
ncbi:MAG TPA: hypothetical protein DEF05_09415 [Erwinia sp.]|nr:hypothetical protein [Erwinia sp.]